MSHHRLSLKQVPIKAPSPTSVCLQLLKSHLLQYLQSVQFSHSVMSDPMDCSTPDFPVRHQLLELTQTHVHRVCDALQPSHPLLSPSPTFSHSQHQYLSSQQYAVDILWCVSGISHVALMVKNPPANAEDIRDMGSIPGSGRSPGGGNGNPLQLFLSGKFHGQKNLEDYSPQGHKESATSDWSDLACSHIFGTRVPLGCVHMGIK